MTRLVRLVMELMPVELRQLTLAAGLDVEATCRLQPLAELFSLARKNLGWSSPRAAKLTHIRRRTVDAAEAANPAHIDPAELIAYATRLGTLHLLGEWVTANPRLATSLGFPDEEALLGQGRQILAEDARHFSLLPNPLRAAAHRRFEAPAGFSEHLDPDRAEARLSAYLAHPPGSPGTDDTPGHVQEPTVQLPSRPAAPAIYQIMVTLEDVTPPVWRRIRVPNSLTFVHLHQVLQGVMGWGNSHLHAFQWKDLEIGRPDPEWNHPVLDESSLTLARLGLRARSRLSYRYDFGDNWRHALRIEKVLPADPAAIPTCIAGEGGSPLEDSGGPFAYSELLKARNDPSHPNRDELLEWIGPSWKPATFDIDTINAGLARLARSWKKAKARRGHQKA